MKDWFIILALIGLGWVLSDFSGVLIDLLGQPQEEVNESSFDSIYGMFNESPHPIRDYGYRVELENGEANKIIICRDGRKCWND